MPYNLKLTYLKEKKMINYTWNVSTVDTYPTLDSNADVIYNVHWRLNATDTGVDAEGNPYTASVYGTQVLDTSDLSNFTNFDSVTSSQVQGWVEGAMGAEEVQSLKDNLDAKIADEINPTSETKTLVS
jgi:hypothetical protein